MKTEFQGKYFNGITSRPFPCRICLGGNSLDIHILAESGGDGEVGEVGEEGGETVHWEVAQISKTDLDFGHKTRLKYGSLPPQTIEVEDERFALALELFYPAHAFAKRDMVSVISGKWRLVVVAFLVLAGLGVFAFLVVVPGVAEYAATKVPLRIEKAIGDAAYGQITVLAEEDSVASALVQQFFEAMPLDREYDYTITVLNTRERNAFAVPGGRIAVYSGILKDMKTPEELAALLLHESAHIELHHSMKSLFRTLSGYLFISLLFGDAGGVTAVVFENIYVFTDLQYSRKMEREADMMGLKDMQRSGFNPEGMIELFRSIKENSSDPIGEHELTEFMSTHPNTARRIEYIRQYVAEDTVRYATLPVADSLFMKLKQIYRDNSGE